MNIIVAVNSDWGIGQDGTQTIVIPEDRRRFSRLTDGCIIICGRKTFEDFKKPLPNRKNIIMTKNKGYTVSGALIKHTVEEVFAEIAGEPAERVFVIGGGSIYRQFLPYCSCAYVTKIEAAPPSDVFFPNLDELPEWSIDHIEPSVDHYASSDATATPVSYQYILYKKQTNPQQGAI